MSSTSTDRGDELPVADGRRIRGELALLTIGLRGRLLGSLIIGVAGAALGLVIPLIVGDLVDSVTSGAANVTVVLVAMLMMALSVVAAAGCNAISVRWAARGYHSMLAGLRDRLFARSMTLPMRTVERAGSGDLISRSSDDVSRIADAAPQLIPALSSAVFGSTVTAVGVVAVDPRYGLGVLVMLPVYVLAVRWYLRTAPLVYRQERAAMSGRAQQIIESQRGCPTILGFGMGARRDRAVIDASWRVVEHSLRARTVQNMFLGRIYASQILGLSAVLVVGFLLVSDGASTVGEATAAALILIRMFGPITQLLMVFDVVQSVVASLGRIVGVTSVVPDPARSAGPTMITADGSVRVSGVRFGYDDGPDVLAGVDLTIAPAEHLALVGVSGAGKTTLAGLIAGVHDPDEGTVARPQRTAVITQEKHVFSGTLRDNLNLAAPSATDTEIAAALDAVGGARLLEAVPDGLDTVVGTHGHALAPAYVQLVALARIVLSDPDFAVLDEATAEAGSEQSGLLDGAAEATLAGRTGLVIAHRLSQAAACDRIVVLDSGVVVEQGDHHELLRRGGEYARMWAAWTSGRESESEEAGQ